MRVQQNGAVWDGVAGQGLRGTVSSGLTTTSDKIKIKFKSSSGSTYDGDLVFERQDSALVGGSLNLVHRSKNQDDQVPFRDECRPQWNECEPSEAETPN